MTDIWIERQGFVEPLLTSEKYGQWPTCYGYLRGRHPSTEEVWSVRGRMAQVCEHNQLYLARVFHDFDAEPTNLDYPGLREVVECAGQPGTYAVMLADLEFTREPSLALRDIAKGFFADYPGVRVVCLLGEEAWGA